MARKKTKQTKASDKPGQLTTIDGMAALETIPVDDILGLQKGVFNVVKGNLHKAREVLEGKRQWNGQQVKLYLALLGKVMPDLSQTYNVHDHHKPTNEMGIEELQHFIQEQMRLASAPPAIPEAAPVTTHTSPLFPLAPDQEPIDLEAIDESADTEPEPSSSS